MNALLASDFSRKFLAPLAAALLSLASPAFAADDPADAPKGAAVTVLKAAKSCFSAIVEVSGIVIPREETAVRPERQGLKVAEILADAGDTVTAGQTLARLTLPEGGTVAVQAPVAGLISASSAVIGAIASGKGEALFSIIARSEFDLVGLVPMRDIAKLAVNQTARIKIIGAGDVDGRVRRVAHRRAQQPARSGVHRRDRHAAPAGEFVRPRADQDRPELRRRGAADRDPLRHRRHRGAGGAARRGSRPGGSRSG